MRRALVILVACVICAVILLTRRVESSRRSQSPSFSPQTVKTAVMSSIEFAKSGFAGTGGIGVSLSTHRESGLPRIGYVVAGSPPDRAGLRAGDLITKVNGLTATNLPLAQLAEAIRCVTDTRATLTIQRGGTTGIVSAIEPRWWDNYSQ